MQAETGKQETSPSPRFRWAEAEKPTGFTGNPLVGVPLNVPRKPSVGVH